MSTRISYSDLPQDTIIICPKCRAKNLRTDNLCRNCETDLEDVKKTLLGDRRLLVRRIIEKHPELKEIVSEKLVGADLSSNELVIGHEVLEEIKRLQAKAENAENLEKAGRFEESARQYEDLGLWSKAGEIRNKGTHHVREREIVLIKCSYCGSLNPQGTLKCSSCGGRL